MHSFAELIYRCAVYTLDRLEITSEAILTELQTSAATSLVKGLQMISLQKAVTAIGIFSMFDAILQEQLNCKDGFAETKLILKNGGNIILLQKFEDYKSAINALKHGKGPSYEKLCSHILDLDFKVKAPKADFFHEGDVSEVKTLIDADNAFVMGCADVIQQVADYIMSQKSGIFI